MQGRPQFEIVGLHEFFQDWLSGTSVNTDEVFGRVARVLAGDFTMITPAGSRLDRLAVLAGLRGAHGSRPGLHVTIANMRLVHQEGASSIVSYEEWHRLGGSAAGRLSTAVLRDHDGLPNGLEWIHVHETWLTPAAASTT